MNSLALVLLLAAQPAAQPGDAPRADDPVYAELMKVRSGLVEAYNRRDVDGILALCHPNIVVTWQNAEVTEGRAGVRGYYEKMMTGPNKIVESMTAEPTVDKLAVIYDGKTAVSRGAMHDHYKLTDGTEFDLNSRWSATLVKEGDTWLIANFHASVGAFDNPLLAMIVSKASMWVGIAAAAVAAVLASVATWILVRRRAWPPERA
jgi:ketosteroid isomerase-like protein